jgi:hypothetical protein
MSIDSAQLLKGRLEEPESVHSRECADSRASPCARLGFLIACLGRERVIYSVVGRNCAPSSRKSDL